MRSESQHPKLFSDGSTGWIHRSGEAQARLTLPRPKPAPEPSINCTALLAQWRAWTQSSWTQALSENLGISLLSLTRLQVCYAQEHRAWAFPMKDGYDTVVGIRLRSIRGDKWAVKGSHQGCFLPLTQSIPALALVAEGPTDTAAGLDLGFYTVGRPSCSGGMNDLRTTFARQRVQRAAIIADNDNPGTRGAQMLSNHLGVPSCIVTLPCKDLRQFLQLGGTRELLDGLINASLWNQPNDK